MHHSSVGRPVFAVAAGVMAIFFGAAGANAVVVGNLNGDGTGNTAVPATATIGWGNVGTRNGSSATYLGNRWVLTAFHVGAGETTFGASSYGIVSGSAVRLTNADSSLTDLLLYRLDTDPGLPSLNLSSITPSADTPVTMIGYGRNRESALRYWDVTGGVWTDQAMDPDGAEATGYSWIAGAEKRWGTNLIDDLGGSTTTVGDYGFGDVTLLRTTWNLDTFDEGQAAQHDSGGGLFGPDGELLGIMLSVGPGVTGLTNQPLGTSIFGNATYSADIATYREQIISIIPEPASGTLLLGALAAAGLRRRKLRAA